MRLALGVADVCMNRGQQSVSLDKDDLGTVSKLLATAQTRLLGGMQFPNAKDEEGFRNKVWEVFTDLNHGIWKACFHGKQPDIQVLLKQQLEESEAKVTQLTHDLKLTASRPSTARSEHLEAHRLKMDLDTASQTILQLQNELELAQGRLAVLEKQAVISPRYSIYSQESSTKNSLLKKEVAHGFSPKSNRSPTSKRLSSKSPKPIGFKYKSATSTLSPKKSYDLSEVDNLRNKLSKEKDRSLSFYRALKRKEKECNDSHPPTSARTRPTDEFSDEEVRESKVSGKNYLEEENSQLRKQVNLSESDARKLANELEVLTASYASLQKDFETHIRQTKKLDMIQAKQRHELSYESPYDHRDKSEGTNKSSLSKLKERAQRGTSARNLNEHQQEAEHLRTVIRMLNDDIKDKTYQLSRQETTFKSVLDTEKAECRLQIERASKALNDQLSGLSLKVDEQKRKLSRVETKTEKLVNASSEVHLSRPSKPTLNSSYQSSLRSSLQGNLNELVEAKSESNELLSQLSYYQDLASEHRSQLKMKSDELEALRQSNYQLKAKQSTISSSQDQLTKDLTELQRHLKSKLDTANNTIRRLELYKSEADQKIARLNKHITYLEDANIQKDAEHKLLRAELSCDRMEIQGLRNQLSPRSVSRLKSNYLEDKIEEVVHSLASKEESIRSMIVENKRLLEDKDKIEHQAKDLKAEMDSSLANYKTNLFDKNQELKALRAHTTDLQTELNSLHEELISLRTTNSHLEGINRQAERSKPKEDLTSQFSDLKQKVENLTTMSSTLEAQASKWKTEAQRLEAELASANQSIFFKQKADADSKKLLQSKHEQSIALKEENDALQNEVLALQGRIKQLLAVEALLKSEVDSLKLSLTELKELLKKSQGDASFLEAQHKGLTEENTTLYSQKTTLETAVKEAWKKMKASEVRASQLEDFNSQLEEKMHNQETQIQTQILQLQQLENGITEREIQAQEAESNAKALAKELEEERSHQASLQIKSSELDANLTQMTEERASLELALSQTIIEVSGKNAEILALSAHNQRLLATVSQTGRDLDEAQHKLGSLTEELSLTQSELKIQLNRMHEAEAQSLHAQGAYSDLEHQFNLLKFKAAEKDEVCRDLEAKLISQSQDEAAQGELANELTNLTQQVAALTQAKSSSETKIRALIDKESTLKAQITQLNEGNRAIEVKLVETQENLAKLESENAALLDKVAGLQEEAHEFTIKIQGLEDNVRFLEQAGLVGMQNLKDAENKFKAIQANEGHLLRSVMQLRDNCTKLEAYNQTLIDQVKAAHVQKPKPVKSVVWADESTRHIDDLRKAEQELQSFRTLATKISRLMGVQPPTSNPQTHDLLVGDIEAFLKQEAILDRLVATLKAGRIEEVEGKVQALIRSKHQPSFEILEKENEELKSNQLKLSKEIKQLELENSNFEAEFQSKEAHLLSLNRTLTDDYQTKNAELQTLAKQLQDANLQLKTYSSRISLLQLEHSDCSAREARLHREVEALAQVRQDNQVLTQSGTAETSEMQRQLVLAVASLRRSEARCDELEKQNFEFRELFCSSPIRPDESDDKKDYKQDDAKAQLISFKKAAADKEGKLVFEIQQLKEAIADFRNEIQDLTDQRDQLKLQLSVETTHPRSSSKATEEDIRFSQMSEEDTFDETKPIDRSSHKHLQAKAIPMSPFFTELQGKVRPCTRATYNGIDWILLESAGEYYWMKSAEASRYVADIATSS